MFLINKEIEILLDLFDCVESEWNELSESEYWLREKLKEELNWRARKNKKQEDY